MNTVQELIEALQKLDPNADVYISVYNGGFEEVEQPFVNVVKDYNDIASGSKPGDVVLFSYEFYKAYGR